MALCLLRLRQTLRTLTPLLGHHTPVPRVCSPSVVESSCVLALFPPTHLQSRPFWSSRVWLSSPSRFYNGKDAEIEPDTLLSDGCDYNHWLIAMHFRDSNPTPEEMVDTFVKTLAKGLNISIAEAKLKMYACSTTIYIGFQAVMTEEESENFRGMPGVVYVWADSYVDLVNKEYGGDKYINGTIIPRRTLVRQHGKKTGDMVAEIKTQKSEGRIFGNIFQKLSSFVKSYF